MLFHLSFKNHLKRGIWWLSRLSIYLQLRSWSQGLGNQALCQAQQGVYFPPPLICSLSLSFSLSQINIILNNSLKRQVPGWLIRLSIWLLMSAGLCLRVMSSSPSLGSTLDVEGGIPGWLSGLVPAFCPGHDPGNPGLSPTSQSRRTESSCKEPASPSTCVFASLSLSLMNK